MIPHFARDIFSSRASGLGLDDGRRRRGRDSAARLSSGLLGDFKRKGWSVLAALFGFGVFLIAFAQSTRLVWSLFRFLRRLYYRHVMGGRNTLLQHIVTDEMRAE